MSKPVYERRYDIDWLRVFAMLTVFFFHNARFFDFVDWHVKNAERSLGMFIFVGFCDTWQMPILMLVSGIGSWFALEFRTGGQYLIDRIKRLLVPLYTVGLFVLAPPQYYLDSLTRGRFTGSFWQFYPGSLRTVHLRFDVDFLNYWSGHLWFLRFLFIFSLLTLALLLHLKTQSGRRQISRLAAFCSRRGGVFLFAVPVLIVRVTFQAIFPGTQGIAEFLVLLIFFLIGYIIAADHRFTERIKGHGNFCFLLGIAGLSALIYLVLKRGFMPYDPNSYSQIYVLFWTIASINTWCWIVFIVSAFAKYMSFNNKTLAYCNEAVLPFYVLHQTIILAVGRYVVRWNMSIPLKYGIITTASFVLIMGAYDLLIKRIVVLRFLFGMRVSREAMLKAPSE